MVNINLLPPTIKTKIIQAKKTADIFSISLVILIIFIVIGYLLNTLSGTLLAPNLEAVKSKVEAEKTSLKAYSDLENQALFLNDRADIAAKIEEQRPVWSQILQNLINSVPQEVQFRNLNANVTKSPNFILQGNTTSEREIIKFKDKLEDSPFFKNVAFKSSSITPVSQTQTTQNNPAPTESAAKITFSLEFDLEQYNQNKTAKEKK